MADGGITLQIGEDLAERLKARAEAAGESLETFAVHALEAVADPPDWDEIERDCEDTVERGDGIPLEEVAPWLRGWGKSDGPPRPR